MTKDRPRSRMRHRGYLIAMCYQSASLSHQGHHAPNLYLSVLINCAVAYSQQTTQNHQSQVPDNDFGNPGRNATFHYVVVGGGTAGLAIAYRLAKDGHYSVAVVEAGGFQLRVQLHHSVFAVGCTTGELGLPDRATG